MFVVEERKTYSHGMARHGTRIGAACMCALSRSPTTEDSEDFESVYRKSEDGASRIHEMYSSRTYLIRTYIVLDERFISPWYLV